MQPNRNAFSWNSLILRLCSFTIVISIFHFSAKSQTSDTVTAFPKKQVIAILGAMEQEVDLLKNNLSNRSDTVILGISFFQGNLQGHPVVIGRCGIGKVNAAIITTLVAEHFKPSGLLFSGIAGGLNDKLQPGDVVIGTRIGYHDYGKQAPDSFINWPTKDPANFSENPAYFPGDTSLVSVATAVAKTLKLDEISAKKPTVTTGIIITGDSFMADGKAATALRNKTGADAIEMEGAAVAQVCYQQKLPCLIIRSLSDNANHTANIDYARFGKLAAANAATLIMAIVRSLPQ